MERMEIKMEKIKGENERCWLLAVGCLLLDIDIVYRLLWPHIRNSSPLCNHSLFALGQIVLWALKSFICCCATCMNSLITCCHMLFFPSPLQSFHEGILVSCWLHNGTLNSVAMIVDAIDCIE